MQYLILSDLHDYAKRLNQFDLRTSDFEGKDMFVRLDVTELERSRAASHYFSSELRYTSNHLKTELLKKYNSKFMVIHILTSYFF